jgi:sterol desaturase/sphingolipid hydroxylase (fatty acid hydroxylase superfamily)
MKREFTIEMHRVHHSTIPGETHSNLGFNFPWWDRLLGTCRDQPSKGHEAMRIGLAQLRGARAFTLSRMLVLPFVGATGSYL